MSTATRLAVVLHPHVQRHCNGRAVTLQGRVAVTQVK